MPQLDTTYFVSQIFWLGILFTLFYLSIRFLVIPKLQSIIHTRSNLKEESDSFVGIVDLEIAQMKIEAKKQSEDTNILIKKLAAAADTKYDTYSRDLLSKLQKKLEDALDDANKEVAELTKKTLAEESMNELVVESAKNMIFKLANINISTNELKNFIKS
jgi:F-type H+-transporting ATPase subunit b